MKKGQKKISNVISVISHTKYDRPEKSHRSLREIEQCVCVNILTSIGENKGCSGNMLKDHHT